MSKVLDESTAMRQMTIATVISFFVGLFGMLALLGWIFARYVVKDGHWWESAHFVINAILISVVFGGLGCTAISTKVLSWYHYRRGVHRCRFCDRPLKGSGIRCDCPEAQVLKRSGFELGK